MACLASLLSLTYPLTDVPSPFLPPDGQLTRVIYDQGVGINGFAGLVSIVSSDDTRAAALGNQEIVIQLLRKSHATLHLNSSVHRIESYAGSATDAGRWAIHGQVFDAVVIAMPLSAGTDIRCVGRTASSDDPSGCGLGLLPDRISKVTSYIVAQSINPMTFGPSARTAKVILTRDGAQSHKTSFISIAQKHRSSDGKTLYKVFSSRSLEESELTLLFVEPTRIASRSWPSVFTRLTPLNDSRPIPFQGAKAIYYLNAIESVTVAMEGSVLAAHNIARLLRHDLAPPTKPMSHVSLLQTFTPAVLLLTTMTQSVVSGWLVAYSGVGSFISSSPVDIVTMNWCLQISQATSLIILKLLGIGSVAMLTTSPLNNIVGGVISGIGLTLVEECGVLQYFMTLPLRRRPLAAFFGLALGWFLWNVAVLRSALVSFLNFISALTWSLFSCDWAVSGPVADASCFSELGASVVLILSCSTGLFVYFRHFEPVCSRKTVVTSNLSPIFLCFAALALLQFESLSTERMALTPVSVGVYEMADGSVWPQIVAVLGVFMGASLCWSLTGRRLTPRPAIAIIPEAVGGALLFLGMSLGSSSTATFGFAQLIVQLVSALLCH